MHVQDTLHSLFEAQVKRRPHDIALIMAGQSLTYQDFNKRVNQLAFYLRENGVGIETAVAICMERSIDLLVTIFAVLKAGGMYIPLDPTNPEVRLLFVLDDTQAPILITKKGFKKKFSQYQRRLLLLDVERKKVAKQATHNIDSIISPDNLAYIIYTSGSTGKPKGVLIEHKSIVNYTSWFADYCDCKPQQRIDFSANYTFDMSVSCSVVPLLIGLTVIIGKEGIKNDPRPYLNYLAQYQVNIIKISPSYLKVLSLEVKNNPVDLTHLQTVILGGEGLSTSDCAAWLYSYPKQILINEYGPTEATIAVTQYRVTQENITKLGMNVPIGEPGKNIVCYIVGQDNTLVKDNEMGELYIGGVCLARGYLNRPELTQKQFIYFPLKKHKRVLVYKTGDLCRWLPNGVIEYLGRVDGQVKIRGYRVEPTEVEKHLTNHPTIHAVVVLGRKDHLNEIQLIAYFILKTACSEPSAIQLRHYLRASLPEYMIPSAFVRVDALPLTSNDKLDVKALPNPQFVCEQHYLAPKNALEKILADIWSEELGISPIGIEDDFFELGGHSLSAARIISKLNKQINKEISLVDFYAAPTIAKLAKVANKKKKPRKKNLIQKTRTQTPLLLNDFQCMLWLSMLFEPHVKKLNITTSKRLQGKLNPITLKLAFETLLKKHEVLSLHIFSFRPMQFLQKKQQVTIFEQDLSDLSRKECEKVLKDSYFDLLNYYPWKKHSPLVMAKLFYLSNNESELQLCMPHIISDDLSPEILLADLSKFYLLYENGSSNLSVNKNQQYRVQVLNEQSYLQSYLDRDMIFWENYLQDAHSFAFPAEWVVNNMKSSGLSYSSYLPIPQEALDNLQRFCARNKVSINDGLCAALILALQRKCAHRNPNHQNIFINIVKSTRDNEHYDDAIGCFLRLEPIKLNFNSSQTLSDFAKQAHQATIDTQMYQPCSGLLKLASVAEFSHKKGLSAHLIGFLIDIYTFLCRIPKLSRKILKMSGRLSSFKRNNNFVLNINIQNQFVAAEEQRKPLQLFGFQVKNRSAIRHDPSKVDSFFDVCFLREQEVPHVIISANIMPKYRMQIAKEMLHIIEMDTQQL